MDSAAGDNPRRRLLRVLAKLGLLLLLGGFLAILLPGLYGPAPSAPDGEVLRLRLADIGPGQARQLEWRSRPLWVLHRSPAQQAALRGAGDRLLDPDSRGSIQPDWARGPWRSRDPAWLVVVGLGTDLGCTLDYLPPGEADAAGGFRDTCRGSRYDASGRVLKGQHARSNLRVPRHRIEAGWLLVGH